MKRVFRMGFLVAASALALLLDAGCSTDVTGDGDGAAGADLSANTDSGVASNDLSATAGDAGGGDVDAGQNPDAPVTVTGNGNTLSLTPGVAFLDATSGIVGPSQVYAAFGDGFDVSASAVFTVDDATLGEFTKNIFTASALHGGTSSVHAAWNGLVATGSITVRFHAQVSSQTCPLCPAFPPDNTPACKDATRSPTVLYPTDGTLVPPNMNVISTQFDQGAGNTLFEIDFENAVTDVRVLTLCNPITDTRSLATNGCIYDLDQNVWDFVAMTNRGGSPVKITVRATDGNAACIAPSTNSVAISFSQEDLNGGIYYWQSVALVGLQGQTGGIYRYDFGKRGQLPDPYLVPSQQMQSCVGCHFLSRDGQKLTYAHDDPDADDEYSDVKENLVDVQQKTVVSLNTVGFQTFSPDHALLLASDGRGMNNPPSFNLLDGNTGNSAMPQQVPTGAQRGTHPDWSPDGTSIVYVQPKTFLLSMNEADDSHFTGGSLYTMSYSAANHTFGAPTAFLTSKGENNFYPAWSPDGGFVIFDRVPGLGIANNAEDSFSNPAARIMVVANHQGAAPIDLTAANAGDNLTNSWPRFAPPVQNYKGHQIAWVTFSSTRNYGDVVRNDVPVNGVAPESCYPPESPENISNFKMTPLPGYCRQPQLWMAAIDLTVAAQGNADPSLAAFWLPFQDPTAHNHIAQWVVSLDGTQPMPDAGAPPDLAGADLAMPPADMSCIADGVACQNSSQCCNGFCIGNVCGGIP